MKTRWTCKQVRQYNAISIGYCEAWHLLRGLEPIAYTAGIYGWNEDVYYIGNNTYITTGYRPHGVRKFPYETYEKQAKDIYDGNETYNTKIAKIAKIREEFLKSVCN